MSKRVDNTNLQNSSQGQLVGYRPILNHPSAHPEGNTNNIPINKRVLSANFSDSNNGYPNGPQPVVLSESAPGQLGANYQSQQFSI